MMANFRKHWASLFTKRTATPPQVKKSSAGVTFAARHQNEGHHVPEGVYCPLEHLLKLRFSAQALVMPSAKRGLRQQSGGHLSRFKGRGMEFAEVRLYQPGDDIRSIDWRVTARRQSPHTKVFHEERERPVLILCDQSSSQFFGSKDTFKCVKAAEAAALLSWATLNHGDRVGGLIFSEKGHCEIKPARNHKAVTRLLKGISDFNFALVHRFTKEITTVDNEPSPTGTKPLPALENALQECRRLSKPGALVFLISDFQDFTPACARLLHIIRQHGDVIAIQTYDPLERELPPPGDYAVSDGTHELRLSTRSHSVRNKFRELVAQRQAELSETLTGLKIPLLPLSTEEATLPFIQKHLRGGGIL
ncbi:MAG: DUF58 domain-containing protein [Hahellaceae bacterium]|nr:DUF58 domain-containing protein [Hahellaceae bacterium]MCP5211990.1 DUF58 domain-containing protein [Hahellaceae bacterium]